MLRLPVSNTAKVMYARLLDEILTRGTEIKSHAAVVAGKLYPDKKPRQQER